MSTEIFFQVQKGMIDLEDPDLKIKVKISGDGAQMTRITNFVVLSFSLLNNDADVMSSKGLYYYVLICM